MAGTATITAPIGPGLTTTAAVYTGVRELKFDLIAASLQVMLADGSVKTFDLKATTTITATASSGTFTFTVSQ